MWPPETPPSPEAKMIDTPRAPSWAAALQYFLKQNSSAHCSLHKRGHSHGQCDRDVRLVDTVAGRNNGRWRSHLQEVFDGIEVAPNRAIAVRVSDAQEIDRNPRGNADCIFNVEILMISAESVREFMTNRRMLHTASMLRYSSL